MYKNLPKRAHIFYLRSPTSLKVRGEKSRNRNMSPIMGINVDLFVDDLIRGNEVSLQGSDEYHTLSSSHMFLLSYHKEYNLTQEKGTVTLPFRLF